MSSILQTDTTGTVHLMHVGFVDYAAVSCDMLN